FLARRPGGGVPLVRAICPFSLVLMVTRRFDRSPVPMRRGTHPDKGSSSTTVGRNKPQAAGNSPPGGSSSGGLGRALVATGRGRMCKDVGRRRDVQDVRLVHFRRPFQ